MLSEEAEAGRALFYSADNAAMAAAGSGISCATCHFQGRTDGLTWPLAVGYRQTPSLAGRLADTAPDTWEGDVATVADEAVETVTDRMGGTGLSTEEADAIEAYLLGLRAPDVGSEDPLSVARGAVIFAAVGCDTCLSGVRTSDEQTHDVFGEDRVNTPSLRGIALTAPYLRSGSVPTLGEVITRAAAGEMGAPFSLTAADARDLEAYLRTL